jgi:O-antigen/teichoic acid export membrane protein
MNSFFRNVSFTFVSNLICTFISVLVTFILPRGISVENYGYYQLYFFYVTYTGFLHFGWADGLYLRYAGAYYKELDKGLFGSQFKLYSIIEFLFGLVVCSLAPFFVQGEQRTLVFVLIGISIAVNLPKTYLQYLLQGTNRIKEYAIQTTLERTVFCLVIVAIVCFGKNSFVLAITADILGKFIALVYEIIQCRELLQSRFSISHKLIKEILVNINVGIKLMLANIASHLILGTVRWSIEQKWNVSVFGKISLTMSVSHIMMIFIRSVSMVMLPALRRIDEKKYSVIYNDIKVVLFALMFGGLFIYYPLNIFLTYWLPEYSDCLRYMAILFPLCIFEGKLSVLVEMYLKTMRLEKKILLSNITTLIFSVIVTFVSIFVLESLSLAVLGMLIIFAFRTTLGEYLLSKHLNIDFYRNIAVELLLVATFICSSWFVEGLKGCFAYGFAYAIFLLLFRKRIIRVVKERVTGKR